MKTASKVVAFIATASIAVAGFSSEVWAQNKDVMKKGEKVYNEYCKTCHQADGKGTPKVFPPLAGSDYLKKMDKKHIIQSVIFGLSGKITVNGVEYNNVMAPIPATYKDEDIAAVITYVYNSWGNKGPTVTPAEVTAIKKEGKPAPAAADSKKKKK
jgi:mono/diheme cytochrome c family protein